MDNREMVLVIDKVAGPTSFSVVRDVRRILGGAKVGHAGSLDPFATGVLVLLCGRATKLSQALLNADKKYRAVAVLGESRDTMDLTGTVTETLPVPELSREQVEAILAGIEGEWLQTPPMYSAKKVQGVRLYELARQNIFVPREPAPVMLYKMQLIRWESPVLEFEVHCSKGTYIRSLADELGRRLGTVAHLTELRRLSCGPFALSEAVTVDGLRENPEAGAAQGHHHFMRLLRMEGISRVGTARPALAAELQTGIKGGNSRLTQRG